jgi:hypothetical protein
MVLPVTASSNRLCGVPNTPMPSTYTTISCRSSGFDRARDSRDVGVEGFRQFLGPEQIPLDRFDAGEDAKAPEDMKDHRRQQPAKDARRVAAWLFALNGVAEVVEGAVAANDNSLV